MKRPHLHSVRARLTLWNVGVVALVLIVLGIALRLSVAASLAAALDREIVSRIRARRLPTPEEVSRRPPDHDPSKRPGPPPGEDSPFHQRVLSLTGQPYFPGDHDAPIDLAAFGRAAGGQRAWVTRDVDGEPGRFVLEPIRRDNRLIAVVQVGRSLEDVNREIGRLTRALLTLIPLALIVAGAGGAFLTNRALRPVRQIRQAAARIGARDLSERLPVTGRDEFSDLARTFNAMLARLEDAFEQQRRFTADASHELRTPLTIIKANTSLALAEAETVADYRQAMEAADRAADRTGRIVQDLLLLARSDAGQLDWQKRPVPLEDLIEQAVETARGPGRAQIDWRVTEDGLAALGDAHALLRLLDNLLDNAARHTPPDGEIVVTGAAAGETVTLEVADTGPGIAPEHLPHVGERFYRADAARTGASGGTGLGLAICRSIVEAHGGQMTIDSALGAGTRICVILPRAASVAAPQLV